jgi:SAM-dependent methyltransferase
MTTTADVWKLSPVVERFLGYRVTIPLASEQIAVMLTLLDSGSLPIENFLDLGCGDGILGAAILGRYPESRGVLADFSDPMLTQAQTRLNEFESQLTFANVDYSLTGWTESLQTHAPFDAIVSGYSIHHQPDVRKRSLYAELFDLLKPGGWFINVEHVAPATVHTTLLFDTHIIDTQYALEVGRGGTQTRAQLAEVFHARPDKDANILAPVETQRQWLREVGFQDVDCYMRIYELAVFGGRKPSLSKQTLEK